jgi:serine/threonine-protein kinase
MGALSYCPLCDQERAEAFCPVHHVPTLPPPAGKPPSISNGSVIVGRYRIDGVLSHGGMGTVLDATQLGINRPMVIKVLRGTRSDDRARVRRFYQEARLVSALDHPHIVRIFEFGVDPEYLVPFIAMERIEGVTLQRLVEREGPLSERRACGLFSQIVRALAEAHGKGVLHRDLKPRNIMVRRLPEGDEHVTVLDFGLAKLLEVEQDVPPLTAPGRTVGTPGFMSPEQVLGRRLDARSDLYGVGCMLFTALNGTPPFDGPAALNVMRKQVREPPPPLPRRLSDGAPPSRALTTLVFSLLEKDPQDRPDRIDEVREQLDRLATARRIENVDTLPAASVRRVTVPARTHPASAPERTPTQPAGPDLRPSDLPPTLPAHPAAPSSLDDIETVRLPPGYEHRRSAEDASVEDWEPPRRGAGLWIALAAVVACAALGTWYVTS